jgi:hypothetical protein
MRSSTSCGWDADLRGDSRVLSSHLRTDCHKVLDDHHRDMFNQILTTLKEDTRPEHLISYLVEHFDKLGLNVDDTHEYKRLLTFSDTALEYRQRLQVTCSREDCQFCENASVAQPCFPAWFRWSALSQTYDLADFSAPEIPSVADQEQLQQNCEKRAGIRAQEDPVLIELENFGLQAQVLERLIVWRGMLLDLVRRTTSPLACVEILIWRASAVWFGEFTTRLLGLELKE